MDEPADSTLQILGRIEIRQIELSTKLTRLRILLFGLTVLVVILAVLGR